MGAETILATVTVVVTGWLLYNERNRVLRQTIVLWRAALRPGNLLASLLLAITIVMLVGAIAAIDPVLKIGWYKSLTGSAGNAGITPFTAFGLTGVIALMALLIAAMPIVVAIEEEVFRAWATTHTRVWLQAHLFGLAHLLVGVTIAAAMALVITGAVLGYRYRSVAIRSGRESGLLASGSLHLAYNAWLIVVLVLIVGLKP